MSRLLTTALLAFGLLLAGCSSETADDEQPAPTLGSDVDSGTDQETPDGDDQNGIDEGAGGGGSTDAASLAELLELTPEELEQIDLDQLVENGVLTAEQAVLVEALLTREEFVEQFQDDLGGDVNCPFVSGNTPNREEICELMQQRQSGEITLEEYDELICEYATCNGRD